MESLDSEKNVIICPNSSVLQKKTQNDLLYSLEYITFVVNYKRKHSSHFLDMHSSIVKLISCSPLTNVVTRAGQVQVFSWACFAFVQAPWLPALFTFS